MIELAQEVRRVSLVFAAELSNRRCLWLCVFKEDRNTNRYCQCLTQQYHYRIIGCSPEWIFGHRVEYRIFAEGLEWRDQPGACSGRHWHTSTDTLAHRYDTFAASDVIAILRLSS